MKRDFSGINLFVNYLITLSFDKTAQRGSRVSHDLQYKICARITAEKVYCKKQHISYFANKSIYCKKRNDQAVLYLL